MSAGIYRSTTGLLTEETRLEAIADNLANYSMPGFKKSVVSSQTFVSAFHNALSNINTPEDGAQPTPVRVDFTQGPIRTTGRPLDFAIEGDAFFAVYSGDNVYYTRNGAFQVNPDGNLVTADGLELGGGIILPDNIVMNDLYIEPDTGILRNGMNELGVIETAGFEDVHRLKRAGPGLFEAPEDMTPQTPAEGSRILNRTLEASNTEIFREITEMIMCMRNFEACHKILQMQDSAEGQMITRMSQ